MSARLVLSLSFLLPAGLHGTHSLSYTMLRLMHGSFLSPGWAHGLQLGLPHGSPLHRSLLERSDPSDVPPFSDTLTLNPNSGVILSRHSLIRFWSSPPLLNSTKRIDVVLSLAGCGTALWDGGWGALLK